MRTSRQKCRTSGDAHPGRVCKHAFSRPGKRWGWQTCYKSQGGKSVFKLSPFQNGGYSPTSRSFATKRLARQNRSQRRLFCSSHLGKTSKISPVCLEGLSDGICLPAVRPSVSSPSVYKINEACACPSAKIGNTSHNLSRRHFFMNQTPSGLLRDMSTASLLLDNLGFVVNQNKSVFTPSQTLEFLGFQVNTVTMTLVVPQTKVDSIKNLCAQVKAQKQVIVRVMSHLIGKLTASIQAIFPAPLHYRHLQHLKNLALQTGGTYDSQIVLNQECYEELQWWLTQLDAWNGRAILTPPPNLQLVIETDASTQGWGAVCNGVRFGGLWSQAERLHHINCLELLAGAFALKSFTKNQILLHVRLRMDNTTAIAYINKLGGTHSLVLSNLVARLWSWALNRGMILSAEHLPGIWNTQADPESRFYHDSSDWKIDQTIFQALMRIQGHCQIDLFANRLNTQLPTFFSWKPNAQSLASDAFHQNWDQARNYAFPPFCLVMKTLAKIREEGGELVLITPVWPTQAWYPVLLEMLVDPPILLPQFPNLLSNPRGELHPPLVNKTLFLAAWLVSNNQFRQREFQIRLPSLSSHLGDQAQIPFTTQSGFSGIAGVVSGKLIHFSPLWQI